MILYSMPVALLSAGLLVISGGDIDWSDWLSFGLLTAGALGTAVTVRASLFTFISLRSKEQNAIARATLPTPTTTWNLAGHESEDSEGGISDHEF